MGGYDLKKDKLSEKEWEAEISHIFSSTLILGDSFPSPFFHILHRIYYSRTFGRFYALNVLKSTIYP